MGSSNLEEPILFDADFVRRFEGKIEKTEGCWIWAASTAGKGYGQMKLPRQRKQEYAHRLAYQIYRGAIPAGLFVCHACDNPKCVNPDHLFLGTCKQNLQDMKSKGRSTHGTRSRQAVLNEDSVRKIRACLVLGMTQIQIAAAFNVSQITVSRINTRQRWARIA
ncbi:HNH endonuclease signature motif containing protein [Zoogloea sp.]|uniref:HNH endonuclease signature motif containing protein n=1 Tax=Zoogloea sp. TaxID=49181 RepID=UPI00345A5D9C